MAETPEKQESKIAEAVSAAVSTIYDKVHVRPDAMMQAANAYELGIKDWDDYQRRFPLKLMDDLADEQIKWAKIQVSSLGAVAGLGGLLASIPDTIQFVTLTLRMVTGIAAAYGFNPAPDYLEGKTKVLILQAYLNANLGNTRQKGIEAVGLGATTKLLKSVVQRSDLLIRLIILIGRIIGIRLTKRGLLAGIPLAASGVNAGFNWFYARQIARAAKEEFRGFRDDLRRGKYYDDPDYDGLGNKK